MGYRDERHLAGLRWAAAVIVTSMLAVAGCGGSSSPKPTGTAANEGPTQTRAPGHSSGSPSVIVKADAICRRLNNELTAAPPRGVEASQIARSAPHNAALEQRAIVELTRITPPTALAGDWRQMIAYRQTLADDLLKLARYAKANDAVSMQALAVSKKRAHQKLSELATRDGFNDCAHLSAARTVGKTLRSLRLGQQKGTREKL